MTSDAFRSGGEGDPKAVPTLTGENYMIWQTRMKWHLIGEDLWGVCDKDQGETPSGAIKTKMAQAAFCIGSKITDQIYMHIFFSCDCTPHKLWGKLRETYASPTPSNVLRVYSMLEQTRFEGSIPKFIADIGHCLAHIKFIGLEVKDVNICYKILNKIIHKRPSLSIMFFGDSATMSDPYVLIEKIRPLEILEIGNKRYWSELDDEETPHTPFKASKKT
ncbi:hypothetical protein MJO28_002705 [Puccinia striiformis f. sp. tritici]|uniref:Uncharacterized protein n=3 Tax=Puccinia striiformis TaxID=27350 RepID=A0A0L0V1P8_9BASI|nr:hypothetical protein Pst134EB_033320 [Puccinia striiformis f. sp. tritici]KAI7958914.1 hypothetical protein MJO28_002705 [Puccinia striiformis f. sp. tritici]KNE93190.1 hypothetical protein PSTG_13441 [Puccinia striiformis f. sp. tritici PST-78]POV96765.1 hypothetical protein PSTT_15468 [Puccinia striiformis]